MASPTVTYTLTNGSTADATQVQQNFNDLISALTDGSKTLSIDALTVAGAFTANGTVNLGNATGDDVTVTGYIASEVLPKSSTTYNLGGPSNKWNTIYGAGLNLGGTTLSSYEEGTFAFYCVDGTLKTGASTARYVKVGKIVSIYLPESVLSSTASARKLTTTDSASTYTWPSALTPTTSFYGNYNSQDGATYKVAIFNLNSSGVLTLYADTGGSNFTTSTVGKGAGAPTTIHYNLT